MSRDAVSVHLLHNEGIVFDADAVHQALLADRDYQRNTTMYQMPSRPMFRAHAGQLQLQDFSGREGRWSDFSEFDAFPAEWLAVLSQHLTAGEVTLTVVGMPDDPSAPRTYAAYRVVPGQVFGGVARAVDLPRAVLIAQNGQMLEPAPPAGAAYPSWDAFLATDPIELTEPVTVADRWVVLSTEAYARLVAGIAPTA
jgi:hypothetical protein